MIDWIKDTLGIYGATFVLCVVSGLILVIQAEVVVVWATMTADSVPAAIAIGLIAGVAQIATRVPIYFLTRRLTHASPRLEARMARARARLARWNDRPMMVTFIAASLGIPPYTAVSLLAGPLELPFVPFVIVSLAGRILRYEVIALAPLLF